MNEKLGYYITDKGCIRFKSWLLKHNTSTKEFASKCGCSRQYIESVIHGKKKVTANVRDRFLKGGYEYI